MTTRAQTTTGEPPRALLAGIWAGILYIVVTAALIGASVLEEVTGGFDGEEQLVWTVLTGALILAGALVTVFLVGLRRRLQLGAAGVVGIVLAGLGAAAGAVPWLVPLWGGLLGIGMMVYALALLREGEAPRWATITFGFGMLAGIAVYFLLDLAAIGPVDQYGDSIVAWVAGGLTLGIAPAVGLIGLGRWLRRT